MDRAVDEVTFRWATEADVPAGAALHRRCWQEAYGPIVDADLLAARLAEVEVFEERWREGVASGPRRLLAVAPDGLLAGFAAHGPSRSPGDAETELQGLYVAARWHGRGVGQALLERVLTDASCSLWVLEDNARARAFYARNGFVADGTRKVWPPLGAWELRLRRSGGARSTSASPRRPRPTA
ncbi:GNAT family N-acetyltransferase [Nocardioides perillae]|uniref:GNAT superfamily N-acetyltransferase n=1 Tax=Nocardioides perillae TaxID=1119534 RepID=A0A7Y9RSL3_9ACTN|nr:GNAT superfamily N-acetyltransferase [Nocardioides perillae]